MACHRCQTGGRTRSQPLKAPPRAAPPSPLCLCLSWVSCPAQPWPQGCWSQAQMFLAEHGRNPPGVEVFSISSYGISLPPSLPCCLVLFNKQLGQYLHPILQMGKLRSLERCDLRKVIQIVTELVPKPRSPDTKSSFSSPPEQLPAPPTPTPVISAPGGRWREENTATWGRERASNSWKNMSRVPPHTPQAPAASPTDSPTHSFTHSLTYSFTVSVIHPLTY